MKVHIITLFPEMFAALNYGMPKRAIDQNQLLLNLINPRDFAQDKHKTVDDRPYGGGPGMVMKVEPLSKAIHAAKKMSTDAPVFYLSPQGKPLKQADLKQWSTYQDLILVAGRYEGIDERLLKTEIDGEWSIGDYVLSGGELAAMVIVDGVARLLPDVLGDSESASQDSFSQGLLDCPHYTRPEDLNGLKVPEILLSGDHEAIKKWRLKQALGKTYLQRPDLLEKYELNSMEKKLLEEFLEETENDRPLA